MSVYLDSVSIAGIMGIPGELSLDFTAPLTLIYAPNGTGKTSTWTAVRALMTMGVGREIACQAAGALSAKVVGQLMIDGENYTATATPGELKLTNARGRMTGTNALARLAPEVNTAGIQTRGGVLRDRLISQIAGCRFLPSESLLYLIDSGEESIELRRRLFADLTGTSALQSEVRETRRYRAKLSEELVGTQRSLQTIDEQLQAFTVESDPNSSDPSDLIAQAAALAGIQLPSGLSAREALSLLRESQSSRMVAFEASHTAHSTWRSIESTYPDLDRDHATASAALKAANGDCARAQQALSSAQSGPESGLAKRARQQYEKFQRGLTRVAALVAAEGRTKLLTSSSVESLRRLLRPFNSEHDIESRLGALQQLDGYRLRYREQISERQDVQGKHNKLLEELHISSAELQASLNEKMVERSELSARISRQSDLAASLRASAQSLIATAQSSICPCCSHRWESVDTLLAAILEGDRRGHTDPRLTKELEAAEAAIGQLQVQYASVSAAEEQLRQLERRLNDLNGTIERIDRLARDNDVPPTRLLEAADTLEEVLTLRSFLALWRTLEALDDLGEELDEAQSIEAALSTLSARGEALKTVADQADQAEADRRLLIEREQSALQSSAELAKQCEEQVVKLARIRHERDAAIEQLRSTDLFRGAQTQAALNEGMATLGKLGSLIKQVAAAIEASAAIVARERITANQRAQESRRDRILREVEHADRLIELLKQMEQQAGKQFFDRLGPAVGTLFDHMQVNRVFRSVEISAVKESFCVGGQLDDGVSLDPRSHFSQGQRQDLALSMFLVRAASLGGSFFLDEPLVHLDDMNRTALLDCLRACILGTASSRRPVRLVVTTANWNIARHLIQKFSGVRHPDSSISLRVIQLSGNVREGVGQSVVFPAADETSEIRFH